MPSKPMIKICSVLFVVALLITVSGCQKTEEIVDSDTVEISVAETPTLEIRQLTVNFAYKKATLDTTAEQELTRLVQQIKNNPGYQVELVGHADAIASDAYNGHLSQQRAEAVRDFLAVHDVAADRMTIAWEGETQPVASNTTEAGRAQNRRAEITLRPRPALPTPTAMVESEDAML